MSAHRTLNGRRRVSAIIATLALALAVLSGTTPATTSPAHAASAFAQGADISWIPGMEAQGYTWKDRHGVRRDILDILKNDYNVDSARIRVFVNPSGDYGNGYMTTQRAAQLAQRAQRSGMRVMLTLHYSDSWADPGKQNKPAAWSALSFQQLMDTVWTYTRGVMTTMRSYGVTPEWVQVGNETNDGMLWNDGRATVSMRNYAWLVTTGHNAVKDVSPSTKTVVHLADGQDTSLFQWNIGGLISNGAQFDMIGMSVYPTASNWRSYSASAANTMNDMVSRYGKEVIVSEIGMDYRDGAVAQQFVADLVTRTKNVSSGKGAGVFYWEPAAYPNYNAGYAKGAWLSNGMPNGALDGFRKP